jgi:hypothetical protein
VSFDLVLGFVLLGLSALTGGLRAYGRHDLLGWRGTMQQSLGERAGDGLHFVTYTICPALLGLSFIAVALSRG